MDTILNLAAILKNQNSNLNFKVITNSNKNIPQSYSILDLDLDFGRISHAIEKRDKNHFFIDKSRN
jgi:hypothetical protein